MLQLIVRRLLIMIPVLFLVSLMVFSLILLVPGDPAVTLAGENATEEQIDATRSGWVWTTRCSSSTAAGCPVSSRATSGRRCSRRRT